MPPRSKQWKSCAKARQAKEQKRLEMQAKNKDENDSNKIPENMNQLMKTSPSRVVLGTLLAGINFQATRTILIMNGCKPCSKSTFYATQQSILPQIEQLSKESCQMALSESVQLNHDEFSQDSRRSSPRHGHENTNTVIDVRTQKVVSYFDSYKSRRNSQGNFTGAS